MAGRPRGIRPTAAEKAGGYGRIGFCKICNHKGGEFLNAAIIRAENEGKPMTAAKMREYMRMMDPEFTADRHVFYNHKNDHLTSPLVTAAEKTRRESPKILPKDNDTALAMIRDLGMQTAIDHPESITPDHAIKAIGEMEKKNRGPDQFWMLLGRMQAGEDPDLIMGEYTEVKELETEAQEATA